MATNPGEHYPVHYETDEASERPTRLPVGEGAVKAAFASADPLKINGQSLYEAAYNVGDIEPSAMEAAIDALTTLAAEKNLLSPAEADNLRQRLKGYDEPGVVGEHVQGRKSMQHQLLDLIQKHPGEMHGEGTARRRRALAMKGLLHKFLGDARANRNLKPMSVAEIQEWVAGVTDRNNMFADVHPEDVVPMLVGGFDAVFRRAQQLPLPRE